jgi:hypothetical protein
MANKRFCGTISYLDENYNVLWESSSGLIWVNKPNDLIFGESNYGNFKARSKEEALEFAPKMLRGVFGSEN